MLESDTSSLVSATTSRPPSLEQYQLLVEDARALGDRRDRVSSSFLSIITLILGAQGYLLITSKDSDVRTTILIWILAVFGTWLCLTWRQAIRYFKELLRFRFFTLKHWELQAFPDDQRYYVAEEILYEGTKNPDGTKSSLADEYTRNRRIHFFSDTYNRLPIAAILALLGVALIRTAFVFVPILTSQGVHIGA